MGRGGAAAITEPHRALHRLCGEKIKAKLDFYHVTRGGRKLIGCCIRTEGNQCENKWNDIRLLFLGRRQVWCVCGGGGGAARWARLITRLIEHQLPPPIQVLILEHNILGVGPMTFSSSASLMSLMMDRSAFRTPLW